MSAAHCFRSIVPNQPGRVTYAELFFDVVFVWIYFHKGAGAGSELISKSAVSGRLARSAYTYLHMPIVAGIILSAVADELVLKHPAI